jgi:hypothetical protein
MNTLELLKSKLKTTKRPLVIPAAVIEKAKDIRKVVVEYTMRSCIVAPAGKLMLSVDYSNQEVYIAAVSSGDQLMLNCFLDSVPDKIEHEGTLYPNPLKDFHTMTGKNCIAPQEFDDNAPHTWVDIATNHPTNIRKKGKVTNFGK